MSEYAGHQFVGIDRHRRRTVLVRTTDAGEVLESVRIPNDVELEALRMVSDRRAEIIRQRIQTVSRLQRLLSELFPAGSS